MYIKFLNLKLFLNLPDQTPLLCVVFVIGTFDWMHWSLKDDFGLSPKYYI